MNHKIATGLLGCLGILGVAALSHSEDKPANASPTANGQQVTELIDQLNDDRFAKREQATEELAKLGHKAVPALSQAATDERPEVSERAFKALGTILEKGDEASKAAVKEKLGELAKSDNAGAAKEAQGILDRSAEKPDEARRLRRPGIIFPRGAGGRIEIAPGGFGGGGIRLGGGVRRMSVRVTDGDKEIEVTEGDRTVKISENVTDGITIEETETKDGKTTTKEYKAANEKELKEKHPEGHKLYKQYAGGGTGVIGGSGLGGIRLEFGGGGELPKEVRGRIEEELKKALPEFGVPGALPGGDIEEELKKAEAELRKMMEGSALPGGIPPEFRKMIEEMEKRRFPGRGEKEAVGESDEDETADAEDDLDATIARLRKSLKESKDEKELLEAMKRLEKIQAEQLERLKQKEAEIERKLKEAK